MEYSDYHSVAVAFGAEGFLLDRNDEDDLKSVDDKIRATFEAAKGAAMEENKAVLINAIIGRTDFRDGSLSV